MTSIQSTLSPPKNAPKWTISPDYATPRLTESSTGRSSSQTPSSGERMHGSVESSSRMSVGSTPRQTASSSSRPRNILDELACRTSEGSATRNYHEEDSLRHISSGSDSSLDSSDIEYCKCCTGFCPGFFGGGQISNKILITIYNCMVLILH